MGGCEPGVPVACGDGVACTNDACNEATDSCDNTPDNGACDNNLYCDGVETCDVTLGCQDGADPNCGDGVRCTVDACVEATDSCSHVAGRRQLRRPAVLQRRRGLQRHSPTAGPR